MININSILYNEFVNFCNNYFFEKVDNKGFTYDKKRNIFVIHAWIRPEIYYSTPRKIFSDIFEAIYNNIPQSIKTQMTQQNVDVIFQPIIGTKSLRTSEESK